MKKVSGLAAVSAVILAGAFSGIVSASAVSSAVIYGCVSKTGTLSKVSTKSPTCPRGTTKLSWGTKGVAGLQGIQGLQGTQGIQGEPGPAGPQGPAGSSGGAGEASVPKIYLGTKTSAYVVQGANTGWLALTPMATITNLPPGDYEVTTSGFTRGNPSKGFCTTYKEPGGIYNQVIGFGSDAFFNAINGTSIWNITSTSEVITLGCSGEGAEITVNIDHFYAKPINLN